MRERKQRAWLHDQKMMVQVAAINYIYKYIEWYDTSECKDGAEEFDLLRGGPNAECTFESCDIVDYTGLQDKNGIEAYEGDIIKAGNSIGVIFYNLDSFNIEWKVDRDFWNEHPRYHVPNGEVIGNIHEAQEWPCTCGNCDGEHFGFAKGLPQAIKATE